MEFQVKYADCDPYRVVHNAKYVDWFESALYKAVTHDLGEKLFISTIRCRYIHAAKYDDHIKINTKITSDKECFHFEQRMVEKKENKVICKCRGKFMTLKSHRGTHEDTFIEHKY